MRRRVGEVLELVQLGGLGSRRPAQLSGGQQQRVALARALVNQPRALLLDEPLGALDLRLRRQLQLELKRIQQEVGITFVHVTHDQEEALTMADTIAVMNEGHIEQLGSGEELYERPRTEFVANFLGLSNLLDGARRRAGAGASPSSPPTRGPSCACPAERMAGLEGAVRVGVRPEKITILARRASRRRASTPCAAASPSPATSASRSPTRSSTPAGRELTVIAPNRHTGEHAGPSAPGRRSCSPGSRSTRSPSNDRRPA